MPENTALVTGAAGGLGTHVTKALRDAGFTVVRQVDFATPVSLPETGVTLS